MILQLNNTPPVLVLDMASKAIAGLGKERAETKGPVWDVAADGIATRSWQAVASSSPTASAQCTNLEASKLPSALV